MEIQTNITKQLCKEYQEKNLVCPPRLQEGIFTVTAIDNLDHNPSSSTASKSFHGTGISIFQYKHDASHKQVPYSNTEELKSIEMVLPAYYTTVGPSNSSPASPLIQTVNPHIMKERFNCFDESQLWLDIVEKEIKMENTDGTLNVKWSAYHSKINEHTSPLQTVSAMLPLLEEEIASHTMVRHVMKIIKKSL